MLDLLQLGLGIVAAGAVSGLLAGLFGIGGGAVTVPVLYQTFSYMGVDEAVRMHLAVGSSVAIIVPTAMRSFLSHRAHGAVDMDLLRSWVIVVPLGAIAATLVASAAPGAALRTVFAIVAVVFGIRLLTPYVNWQIGAKLPGGPVRAMVGAAIGFTSALLGIGGGILNNTFMTLFGRSIRQAVATSSGVGALLSIPAVVGFIWAGWGVADRPPYTVGFLNLPAIALIIPISVTAAPFGVRLAHRLPRRYMEVGFGVFLLIVAVRFAWTLV
ncbi:MAG: sulfite exporter TauE/SafE family protein [Alphaproteobacteria bacterium]